MSTVGFVSLNKDRPSCRLAISVPTKDYWDDTNKRYKSGVVQAIISSVAFSGTFTSGEKLALSIAPPNYRPNCHGRADDLNHAVDAGSWTTGYLLNTAVNYGLLGPSAAPQPDGSNDLIYVDVSLIGDDSGQITSDVTILVTYTVGFTEISPYSTLSTTDTYTDTVALNDFSYPPAWGTVTVGSAYVSSGAAAVQLTNLESHVTGDQPGGAPVFVAATMPQVGQPGLNYSWQVPATVGRSLALADRYTWVFAVNGGRMDAAATPVQELGSGKVSLCNFGLVGGLPNVKAKATLSYRTKAVEL